MSAELFFFQRRTRGWTNDELAQFARIENLLRGAMLDVEYEYGESDEGDPWCVFSTVGSADVVIHIARIDGRYVFDSPALHRPIEGRSLENCAEKFADEAALLRKSRERNQVFLHPSAMLAGVALTLFLYVEAATEGGAFRKRTIPDGTEEEASEGISDGAVAYLKQLAMQVADLIAGRFDEDRCRTQNQNCAVIVSANATALAATYEISRLFDVRADVSDAAIEEMAVEAETAEQAEAQPEASMRETAQADPEAVETGAIGNAAAVEQGEAEVTVIDVAAGTDAVRADASSAGTLADAVAQDSKSEQVVTSQPVENPMIATLSDAQNAVEDADVSVEDDQAIALEIAAVERATAIRFAEMLLENFEIASRAGHFSISEESIIVDGAGDITSLSDAFEIGDDGPVASVAPSGSDAFEFSDVAGNDNRVEADFVAAAVEEDRITYSMTAMTKILSDFYDQTDAHRARDAGDTVELYGVTIDDGYANPTLARDTYFLEDGSRIVIHEFEGTLSHVSDFIDQYSDVFSA